MMTSKIRVLRWAMTGAAAIAVASAGMAQAQEVAPAAAAETRVFDVPAQPLAQAAIRFSEQAGVQLVFEAGVAEGVNSGAVSGELTVAQAVQQLLAGTGLSWRWLNSRTITIERAASATGERMLGAVRVEGAQRGGIGPGAETGTSGVNGSTDPTATEDTGSYTTGAATIASKHALQLKEIPQSVSVLTQQRIQDQNITSVVAALAQSTGITLQQGESNEDFRFYSRGYRLESFQIDGNAPVDFVGSGYVSLPDLAQYDHVELLRGSDALFSGAGNPGGTINLVRKRPLDHSKVAINGLVGSWNYYRTEVDLTAPLVQSGKIRGRAVVAYEEREFFYDVASSNKTLLYGVLEFDLPFGLTGTLGGSFENRRLTPWELGLIRFADGQDPGFRRSTALLTDWSRQDTDTREIFGRISKSLGERWSAQVNLNHVTQDTEKKYGYVQGLIYPNGQGPTLDGQFITYRNKQFAIDGSLSGTFELFGNEQKLSIGSNYKNSDSGGNIVYNPLYETPQAVDVFRFDPAAFPEPANPTPFSRDDVSRQRQFGAYINLNLVPVAGLTVSGGARYSNFSFKRVQTRFRASGDVVRTNSYSDHGVITPFASIQIEASRSISFYGSYAEIYRSQANFVSVSFEPLGPIRGNSFEIGAKGSWNEDRLNGSVALYEINQVGVGQFVSSASNLSEVPPGANCCYAAAGETISRGIDIELTGKLLPFVDVSLGYTFNKNKYGKAYDDLAGSPIHTFTPRHLLKLWVTVVPPTLERLKISAGVNGQTKMRALGDTCIVNDAGEFISCEAFDFTQKGYVVASARAAYRIGDRYEFAINVDNIFDKRYFSTVGTPTGRNWYGEPRKVMMSLRSVF